MANVTFGKKGNTKTGRVPQRTANRWPANVQMPGISGWPTVSNASCDDALAMVFRASALGKMAEFCTAARAG
jgi:hypothetical protein